MEALSVNLRISDILLFGKGMVKSMDILVIESSPHKKGSSNLLAEHFIQGAVRFP